MIDVDAFFCGLITGVVALFAGFIIGFEIEQNTNYTKCLEMGYTVPVCQEIVRGH